jgi:hypothetical protein
VNRTVRQVVMIRGMHPWCFRSGEWATIVGIEFTTGPFLGRSAKHVCFQVVFPDGVGDSWVVYDEDAEYEFRSELSNIETPPNRASCPDSSLLAWGQHLIDGSGV